ncbi:lipoprotein [Oleiagrimonas sp. C23AA]|uniref:LPS translocon maturation chaperone LptM n=1 Tax=Oleiagrimonas sp. C23AA TaxID=2719047 RepID=UPI00141F2AD0|nr:lipoprotein [Oleiagrimonas sp. C23AA]NII10713.1 lipoprotein [Oleiagrimonas sp. C23AA]
MRRIRQLLVPVLLASALAGCGYKGPLYMPRHAAPKPATTPAPAPASTVPAPATSSP